MKTTEYCECNFAMIMRGENDTPYCSECGKIIIQELDAARQKEEDDAEDELWCDGDEIMNEHEITAFMDIWLYDNELQDHTCFSYEDMHRLVSAIVKNIIIE